MQIWRCRCWQNTRQLFQIWHTAEGLLVEIITRRCFLLLLIFYHYTGPKNHTTPKLRFSESRFSEQKPAQGLKGLLA